VGEISWARTVIPQDHGRDSAPRFAASRCHGYKWPPVGFWTPRARGMVLNLKAVFGPADLMRSLSLRPFDSSGQLAREEMMSARFPLYLAFSFILTIAGFAHPGLAQGSTPLSPWTWTEAFKIQALSDAAQYDDLGSSVSISGNTALVGARDADLPAGLGDAGAAYVFVFNGVTWLQEAKLTAADAGMFNRFGRAVALDGDTAIVGAAEDDDLGAASGSAYVFVRSGTVWTQQAKLTAQGGAAHDWFGLTVDLLGDTAVVGANAYDHPGGSNAGAAFVFERTGTTWSQQALLVASDADADDNFGCSVSISEDLILVGARWEDPSGLDAAGSAYVFERSGSVWSQERKLTAGDADAGAKFGCAVSLDGNLALVGAESDDDLGVQSGSAYLFRRGVHGSWWQEAKLLASDGDSSTMFGHSVSVSGDRTLIGAWEDDDNVQNGGAAYVFARESGIWGQEVKLVPGGVADFDFVGNSVSLCGSTALVGAIGDDGMAIDAGAACVFQGGQMATCQWNCGTGINATSDGYTITSPATLGGTFGAAVTGCGPGSTGAALVAYASQLTFLHNWGEILVNVADPLGELMGMPISLGNPALFNLPVPSDPFFAGLVIYTQAASFGGGICLHCAYECVIGY